MIKHKKDPLIFQGKNKIDKYFEGWYFKQVSSDLQNIISIIPGISINNLDSHSFVQVIVLSELKTIITQYFRFTVDDFKYTDAPFSLRVGNNTFENKGITLNLMNSEYEIQGEIQFSEFYKIRRSILQPNAMGYFSYFPFMECNHDIISMNHGVKGELLINNNAVNLNDGKGYIEKDWGVSFPKEYIWLQSNHFEQSDASIMFSLAHIPFLCTSFQGFICNLTFQGQEYRFATYNNSKITKYKLTDNLLEVVIIKGKYKLIIKSMTCENLGPLKAPKNGSMNNIIKEGLSGYVDIMLLRDSIIVFKGHGNPCAIEIHK